MPAMSAKRKATRSDKRSYAHLRMAHRHMRMANAIQLREHPQDLAAVLYIEERMADHAWSMFNGYDIFNYKHFKVGHVRKA